MVADRNQKWYSYQKKWYLSHFAGAIKILMRKCEFRLFSYYPTQSFHTHTQWINIFLIPVPPKRKGKPSRMAPKGIGAAAKAVAKGRGRGGGGRGAGRKASPVNSAGTDSAAAPKRTQQSLGDLLGERFAKKQKTVADAIGARTVGGHYLQVNP